MIIQNPNKILRIKSKEVPVKEIGGVKIKRILEEMKNELLAAREKNGVAFAAPQIGYNLKIFIILSDLVKMSKGEIELDEKMSMNKPLEFSVFINPEIIKKSKKNMVVAEGCLSVYGLEGKVKRAEKLTVKALDENGREFKTVATRILSQAIQHEIDHLDGILFIDKALEIKRIKNG